MNLKINGKVFMSKYVGTGPLSYKKRIYQAAVSQRLRNTALQHAVPHLCRAQYCRVSSIICCYAARSRFACFMSWLGLQLHILYYFLLSLHKLSIKYYLYIHTPQSKGHKMLNDRNTKRNLFRRRH